MQSAIKVAWGNRGYDDGYKNRLPRRDFPDDEARAVYIDRYAIGQRERLRTIEEEHNERSH